MENNALKELLPSIVDGFASNILAYAVLLAAISTIVMALLELAKGVLRLRLLYNRGMIKKWIRKNSKPVKLNSKKVYDELVTLSVANVDSANAIFDQATEKMMGQIQAASNIVMDYPELYPDLYLFLTNVNAPGAAQSDTDNLVWMEYSKKLNSGNLPVDRDQAAKELQQATQARSRVEHYVTRKLDSLQTSIDYFWARLNQTVSIAGSVILIFFFLGQLNLGFTKMTPNDQATPIHIGPGAKVLLSLFGGLMAPFAKDVVSALSGLRTKK